MARVARRAMVAFGVVAVAMFAAPVAAQAASLRITSAPAGAEVTINGMRMGVTPLTVPGLAPGGYMVVGTWAGGGRAEQRVDVSAGQTLDVSLAGPNGGGGAITQQVGGGGESGSGSGGGGEQGGGGGMPLSHNHGGGHSHSNANLTDVSEPGVTIRAPLTNEVHRIGVGWLGQLATGGVNYSVLSLRYWFNQDIGINGGFGIGVFSPGGGNASFGLSFYVAGLFSLARYEYLNIYAQPRFQMTPLQFSAQNNNNFTIGIGADIVAELFLDIFDFIRTSRAISINVGIGAGLSFDFPRSGDPTIGFGTNTSLPTLLTGAAAAMTSTAGRSASGQVSGSFGVNYYF